MMWVFDTSPLIQHVYEHVVLQGEIIQKTFM